MIDPDHFHEGDTPEITQAKRIACTWDILSRYAPIFENCSTPEEFDICQKAMKNEMDERFASMTKKPIVVPIERTGKARKIKKPRALSPNTFIFHLGVKGKICANDECQKLFLPKRANQRYCSIECKDSIRKRRSIEAVRKKRFDKKQQKDKK